MFEALFGAEMPLALRFLLAFLIVLGLIGATAWAVRRFGAGRLGGANARGRQPRLAVIDYASVDGRRRLILVRRDNVEHLLMIGGPTDVVVEPNIVRAVASSREVVGPRPPLAAEPLPRAIPLPETASNGSWPLQPEPAALPRQTPRIDPTPEEPAWPLQPQADTAQRPQRDTLAALADELSNRPAPSRSRMSPPGRLHPAEPRQDTRQDSRQDMRSEFRPEPRQDLRTEFRQEPRQDPRQDLRQEPRQDLRQEPRAEFRPEPRPERPEPRIAVPSADEPAAADEDESLAEMAQRLESALRKPAPAPEARETRMPETRIPMAPSRPVPPAIEQTSAPSDIREVRMPPASQRAVPPPPVEQAPAPELAPLQPPPRPLRMTEPRPAVRSEPKYTEPKANEPKSNEPKPNPGKTTLYDSLEQEMANLLGRPTSKT